MRKENIGDKTILTSDEGKLLVKGSMRASRVILGSFDKEENWIEVDKNLIIDDEEISDEEALAIITGGIPNE